MIVCLLRFECRQAFRPGWSGPDVVERISGPDQGHFPVPTKRCAGIVMDALSLIGIKQLPACISYSNPSLEEDRKSWSCFNFADHTRLCNPTTRGPGHYARVYEKSQTYSGEERGADAARDPAVLCQCGKRGKQHYIHDHPPSKWP